MKKKIFVLMSLAFPVLNAFAQCKQVALANIPEGNQSAVALINQADAVNTGVFDLLLERLVTWNKSQTAEKGIPSKITTEIEKSLKSSVVQLDLCLQLSKNIQRSVSSAEIASLSEVLRKSWYPVISNPTSLVMARKDKKFMSPYFSHRCENPTLVDRLGASIDKRCYDHQNKGKPASAPAQFIAAQLVEREMNGVDLEEYKKLALAQSGLPSEATDDSTVLSYIEGFTLSNMTRSYALMIDEVLDTKEKNEVETLVRSSIWKSHTDLQKVVNDSAVLDALISATCNDVKKSLSLFERNQTRYLCGNR